ncbi:MAG: sodium:proton antiporter [Nitrospira sp.]|nr:sodium:proton antiporter [Nitrospira sp.]
MSIIDTITVLVCLSAIFSYINHRWLRLPLTIGLMAIALAMSLALVVLDGFGFGIGQDARNFIDGIDFNETLMHGMLSFLLFAGALHVDLDALLRHKWIVAALASLGVIVSTVIVGVLSFYAFQLVGLDLPLLACFIFGALISPTDPIAVLAILKQAGAPESLKIKIAGESLLNDGVGVVLFLLLTQLAVQDAPTAGHIALFFLQEVGGGAAIGLFLGVVAYRMLKPIDQHQVEILITLALVMGGYAIADALHASGPIAVVVAGLLIGNHGRRFALSESSREYLDTFWELVDELLNAVLFVLIGLEVLVLTFQTDYLEAGLLAIPIVLVARFVSVGMPVWVLSLAQEVSRRATLILTWGGLRGGVSVALALSLHRGTTRDALLVITYTVVVFSILVQGLTIGRLIRSAAPPPPSA